jgi:hypothetical protein
MRNHMHLIAHFQRRAPLLQPAMMLLAGNTKVVNE